MGSAMEIGLPDSYSTFLFFSSPRLCSRLLQIEAEPNPEIAAQYPVKSVPTCVMLLGGAVIEVIEGASSSALVQAARRLAALELPEAAAAPLSVIDGTAVAPSGRCGDASAASAASASALLAAAESKQALHERLRALVSQQSVMVFMKVEFLNKS